MNWRSTIFVCVAAVVTSVVNSDCEAQIRSPQKLGRRVMQWAGHGWSAGYHYCNPGPNTDYYQPWTAHNSYLLSEQLGPSGHALRRNYGIPYSVYANGSNQNLDVPPMQSTVSPMQAPFPPSKPEDNTNGVSPSLKLPSLDRTDPPQQYRRNTVEAIREKLDGN